MKKGIVFLFAAMLLLNGCINQGGGAAKLPLVSTSPEAAKSGEASSDLLRASPGASSQPTAAELSMDAVKDVQVALIPIENERRVPLLPDRENDKNIISRLLGWIHEAKVGQPLVIDERTTMNLRPQIQIGIETKSGELFTLEPVCTSDIQMKVINCHEEEGRVNFYVPGAQQPEVLVSPDLAYWVNKGSRYDTVVIHQGSEPRAVGISEQGKLTLVPQEGERLQQMEVPSCTNSVGDYHITGTYMLTFTRPDGSIQSVKMFSGLNLIRPDLQPMQMEKLTFVSFEAFVFTPDYTDCHGVEFYLFGAQDGKAFPMPFQVEGNKEEQSFYISPLATPKVVENKLVVDGGYAAGMDDRTRYTFQPDLSKKRMVLVKQESIPIN
jgi:hypothetical protein